MSRPIEGNIVDVLTGEIFPGRIGHEGGVITSVERTPGPFRSFLVPGFIDCHVHIDSSLLCPSRFAEAAVPHGTTAVVTDPHEIANVLGVPGIAWMREDAACAPFRVFFTAPSCVPATPFETSGATLGPAEVEKLLAEDDVVALGEVMNYHGAIARDPDVMAKIRAARVSGKPIDGHGPLLAGNALREYLSLGISTDHECTGAAEAFEKHDLGMRILVRDGSAAKNLAALAPFARMHEFLLVTDDILASDLLAGHLDTRLATAVSLGVEPLHALRAATIRPAEHYRLPLGAMAKGRKADAVRVADLSSFAVEEVYIGGTLVAAGGAAAFAPRPVPMPGAIRIAPKGADDFALPASGRSAKVRVIRVIPDEIVTGSETADLRVEHGRVVPDAGRDVLLISVVNRYREAPVASGFVSGFGLKTGAIASSVAHDSHNIIAVGTNPGDMAAAVGAIVRESGGLAACGGGSATVLPLPLAGLMSGDPPRDVHERLERLHAAACGMGCVLPRPFMTLSFLSLLVIPRLKIGDRGLFDADAFRFVEPVIGE